MMGSTQPPAVHVLLPSAAACALPHSLEVHVLGRVVGTQGDQGQFDLALYAGAASATQNSRREAV